MTDMIAIRRWDTEAVIYDGPRDGLAGRNLSYADFAGANLRGVDLTGTKLSNADLSRADLRGAKLHVANLLGANLMGAKFCTKDGGPCTLRAVWQAGPLGSRGDMLMVFATDIGLLAHTGCFGPAPVEDFIAAVTATHGDNRYGRAYRAAIECARAALEVYAP